MTYTNNKILSEIFIKRIYAKGRVCPKDLADWIVEKVEDILRPIEDMQCDCSKCGHSKKYSYWTIDSSERKKYDTKINKYSLNQHYSDDNYHYIMEGLTEVIYHHYRNRVIEPVIETDREKNIISKWLKEDGEINEGYYEWDDLDELKWKFVKGGRKMYLDSAINHIILKEG